jgi:preprotein translocase subunit Sss1
MATMNISFDTHQLVKELKQHGFSDEQAEGINDALKNALTVAEVATRRDLKELELNLTIKIGLLIVAALGFLTALQKIL